MFLQRREEQSRTYFLLQPGKLYLSANLFGGNTVLSEYLRKICGIINIMDIKKLVMFDLDGTLINAYEAIYETLNYTLKQMGYNREETYDSAKRAVGLGDKKFIEKFFKPMDIEKALKIYNKHHVSIIKNKTFLMEGAKEVISYLKSKGVFLAVTSNRPGISGFPLLESLGIKNYFQKITFGDMVQNPKPHPQMLEDTLNFFHVDKHQIIFVGDMTIDVQTGKNADVFTAAVSTGSSYVEELKSFHPDLLYTSLFDFLKFLKFHKPWDYHNNYAN
ncbi:MAG: HAD family hydrolase [Candidatus Omnitrophica bacterium]|nr:HAD family hydrolase [Candidatus Omnitrophota bacterium]